jgi:hypothetical protein
MGIYSGFGIGTELAVPVLSEAAALEMAETDSAVKPAPSARQSAQNTRAENFRYLCEFAVS